MKTGWQGESLREVAATAQQRPLDLKQGLDSEKEVTEETGIEGAEEADGAETALEEVHSVVSQLTKDSGATELEGSYGESAEKYDSGSESSRVSARNRFSGTARVSPDHFAVLSVKDIRYKVKGKELLKGISFNLSSGQALAIMGPSGAGKTVLLDLLTYELSGSAGTSSAVEEVSRRRTSMRRSTGSVDSLDLSEASPSASSTATAKSGSVELNEQTLSFSLFQKHCSYVPQIDRGWGCLSCKETLMFAAMFGSRMPAAVLESRVEGLLDEVGLQTCANTRVGNDIIKGLSGGQKRRLSLAVALLKDPRVIFLDEVTSGLDSAAAVRTMKFVCDFARSKDIIVVCTVHQPPGKVFSGFDRVLLLSRGQTAYFGRARHAVEWFASIGRHIPDGTSPAEFLLDEINADFTHSSQVQEVLDAWREHDCVMFQGLGSNASVALPCGDEVQDRRNRPGVLRVTAVLLRRHLLLMARDRQLYALRGLMYILCNVMVAVMYSKSRARTQEQALNKVWLLIWHLAIPTMGVTAVFGLNQEFQTAKREMKAGMYGICPYIISSTLTQMLFMFTLSSVSIAISGYAIGNWNPEHFLTVVVIVAVDLFAWESIAQYFCSRFSNPIVGTNMCLGLFFRGLLVAGIYIKFEDLPPPMRFLCFIMPIRYSVSALTYTELHDATFDGAVLDAAAPRGYSCPDNPTYLQCFGRTGPQVLKSFHATFDVIKNEDTVLADIGCMLLISLVFKLLFTIVAYKGTRGGDSVSPSLEAPFIPEVSCQDEPFDQEDESSLGTAVAPEEEEYFVVEDFVVYTASVPQATIARCCHTPREHTPREVSCSHTSRTHV